jgi:REP element-mobilizing transposase RayT
MSPKNQLRLHNEFKFEKEFGGSHLKNSHAKRARPIAIKKSMHLTLRSSLAKGDKSFRYNKSRIQRIHRVVRKQALKFGIEIYRYANVGNHIHLLVKASYRKGFLSFLKAISGIIARIAMGAERGKAKLIKFGRGFWDQRPWTRVLLTWTDFINVKKYVEQNFCEALGFKTYQPRSKRSSIKLDRVRDKLAIT